MDETDRISVALNIFGVSRTIALNFDRIDHTTDLLYKIKFWRCFDVFAKLFMVIRFFSY